MFSTDAAESRQLTDLNEWMFSNEAMVSSLVPCNLNHLEIRPDMGIMTAMITQSVTIHLLPLFGIFAESAEHSVPLHIKYPYFRNFCIEIILKCNINVQDLLNRLYRTQFYFSLMTRS